MEKGDMGVPGWGSVRSVPKRMIARDPTVVRDSLVDEDEPARSCRVPRVLRNHVQRGLQLIFERFSHSIPLRELSNIQPLSKSWRDFVGEISLDSASYGGLVVASQVRLQDSCCVSRVAMPPSPVLEAQPSDTDCRDGRDTGRSARAGNTAYLDGPSQISSAHLRRGLACPSDELSHRRLGPGQVRAALRQWENRDGDDRVLAR